MGDAMCCYGNAATLKERGLVCLDANLTAYCRGHAAARHMCTGTGLHGFVFVLRPPGFNSSPLACWAVNCGPRY